MWIGHIQIAALHNENMVWVIEILIVMVLNKVAVVCFVTDPWILAELMP